MQSELVEGPYQLHTREIKCELDACVLEDIQAGVKRAGLRWAVASSSLTFTGVRAGYGDSFHPGMSVKQERGEENQADRL